MQTENQKKKNILKPLQNKSKSTTDSYGKPIICNNDNNLKYDEYNLKSKNKLLLDNDFGHIELR